MKKIAFLVTDDFEDDELSIPYQRLKEAGHKVLLVGTAQGKTIVGKRRRARFQIDLAVESVKADDFDALVIPGGYSPDRLRLSESTVNLVRDFYQKGRPLAAICHGPQLLISADVVRNRQLTCWPSVIVDVQNAGGIYRNKSVVIDNNLITSRGPADIPQFVDAIISLLEGAKQEQLGA